MVSRNLQNPPKSTNILWICSYYITVWFLKFINIFQRDFIVLHLCVQFTLFFGEVSTEVAECAAWHRDWGGHVLQKGRNEIADLDVLLSMIKSGKCDPTLHSMIGACSIHDSSRAVFIITFFVWMPMPRKPCWMLSRMRNLMASEVCNICYLWHCDKIPDQMVAANQDFTDLEWWRHIITFCHVHIVTWIDLG